jgi:2'-5' RNA ligase
LRAFVAIEIPNPKVMDALVAFQRELSATHADLKLVERENLHFTVKFLGEITAGQAAEADRRLRDVRMAGTTVSVRGAGAFPSLSRPRVVWAGVAREDSQKVVAIAEPITRSLKGIGEEDSRPFQAHLSLARVRSGANWQDLEALLRASADRLFGSAEIGEFKLKSSVLTPRGPIYNDVGVYPLS